MTYPITAQVFPTVSSDEQSGAYVASRLLRVDPEIRSGDDFGDVCVPGAGVGGDCNDNADRETDQIPCTMGMLPLLATLVGLALIRRRLWHA